MKKGFLLYSFVVLLFLSSTLTSNEVNSSKSERGLKNIVSKTEKINLKPFPRAFNPSLIQFGKGFLLTFREIPEPSKPWISYIGVVLLDSSLKLIAEPELLDTRLFPTSISQSEDARVFSFKGELFLLFNDSQDQSENTIKNRRDMFIAKLNYNNNRFSISTPIKLIHKYKYATQFWQKNWVPFEWNNQLLLSYSIAPHEILSPDLTNGDCTPIFETHPKISWDSGPLKGGTPATLRGGTAATLVDGEYLAFFHSSKQIISNASEGLQLWHYFMGAYTFSASPPFAITKISQMPIIEKSFYQNSVRDKRVIYPGGYAVLGPKIYVAYGRDDCEIWIATINKNRLYQSLRPVE